MNSRSGSAPWLHLRGCPSGTQESCQEHQSSGGGGREGRSWGRLLLGGFLEASRGPLEEGQRKEPPGAWLLQAIDPESAECPGSGQPPAHGDGQLSGRKALLFSRLFNCPGARVPPLWPATLVRGCGVGEIPGKSTLLWNVPSSKAHCLGTWFKRSKAGDAAAAPCTRVSSRVWPSR